MQIDQTKTLSPAVQAAFDAVGMGDICELIASPLAPLKARIVELEKRLYTESPNTNKPPSSDGLKHKTTFQQSAKFATSHPSLSTCIVTKKMNTYDRTNKLSPLPRWRKTGREMIRMVAIFCVAIVISRVSGTAHAADPLVITAPPAGIQTMWPTTYVSTKYLRIDKYNIHILGSPTVSDWFMRESHGLITNMVDAMKRPEDRAKFSGFQALLITNADPDLTFVGSIVGHRNSGGDGWSLFNEALVCATAVDTIYPDLPAVYRGWETPVHEFGHAVEGTLGLEETTRAVRAANGAPTNGAYGTESYAWALENWFSVRPGSSRSNFSVWEYNYMASVFDANNTWIAPYEPRPGLAPVGPVGFTWCSAEGGSFTLPGLSDVAYGSDGKFTYLINRTGGINFNNSTFGNDPNPTFFKSGFYRLISSIVPPAGYTWCGGEGESFTLPGASDVAYGANGSFNFVQNRTGLVRFIPSEFGGNSNDGILKSGFYKLLPPSNIPVGPAGYTWCSSENGTFTLPGVCDLAYGFNGAFVFKNGSSGTITFNNAYFGIDPTPGVAKNGFYKPSTIPPDNSERLTFTDWALNFNVTGGVNGDSDKDGIANGIEYALQTDPNKADGSVGTCQGRLITFEKRPTTSGNSNLTYQIEVSSDLGKTDPWRVVATTQDSTKIETQMPQAQSIFARLRIEIK